MRIALAQTFCKWGDVTGNLRRHDRLAERAQRAGADLLLFPETSIHGLWKDHLVRLAAEPLDGPIAAHMRALARRHRLAVGYGLAETTPGKPYNAYVLLDTRGRRLAVHRKNYPTGLERHFYRAHRRRPVFTLHGVRTAIGICADCHHPELLRSYARRGARLVLMPHAWDADPLLKSGRPAGWPDMEYMVDAFARGRVARFRDHDEMLESFVGRLGPVCRDLGLAAAFVNQAGQPHPLIPFRGPSFLLDGCGRVVAHSRTGGEGLLVAELEL
ncbi:MAG: carbon-nitrogen hydrolase family protein [Gemmatimonadota bacterium]